MPNVIPYKSFCWSLGTTSFRTKNFNKTIEEQLSLLDEFWKLEEIKIYKLVIMILCNLKTLLKAMPETNQKTLVKRLRA